MDTSPYIKCGNSGREAGLDKVTVREETFNPATLPVMATPGN